MTWLSTEPPHDPKGESPPYKLEERDFIAPSPFIPKFVREHLPIRPTYASEMLYFGCVLLTLAILTVILHFIVTSFGLSEAWAVIPFILGCATVYNDFRTRTAMALPRFEKYLSERSDSGTRQ
jgi:hypothetical protein